MSSGILDTKTMLSLRPNKKKNKKVSVWARIRPTTDFAHQYLELLPDGKSINVHLKKNPKKGAVNNQILDWPFKLDGIFHNASQENVFNSVVSDLVTSALDGFNGTLMCYGQTGAGKTFTITGSSQTYKDRGMIARGLTQLYREIEDRPEFSIAIKISFFEIYNEIMYDLLASLPNAPHSGERLVVMENQNVTHVIGLGLHVAENEEEALNLLFEGETNRSVAAHALNRISSRSHCIFTVHLESRSSVQSNARMMVSKLNFVDLAGSERIGKSKSGGKMLTEAMYINKSLSFLEQMVAAKAKKNRDHVPHRQSKLTHYLKDSIGGNCNTVLIANIWGDSNQLEETVATLRFASRMKCVAKEPKINEVYDPEACKYCKESNKVLQLMKKMQREINYLRAEQAAQDMMSSKSASTPTKMNNRSQMAANENLTETQKNDIKLQCRRYLEGTLEEIDIVNLKQIQGTFEAFRELFLQMEQEVEDRLRQKFTMIDKADSAAIAAAQQAGMIADESDMVGETDGSGFGLGCSFKSCKADAAVVQLKKKEREREKKKMTRGNSTPGVKPTTSPCQSVKGEREQVKSPHGSQTDRERDPDGSISPVSSGGGTYRPDKERRTSTPPCRNSAFEEFKQDKGSEINKILIDNKEVLLKKKKAYSDLAKKINAIKTEIESTRHSIDRLRMERELEGPVYNDDGDIIISEEEYLDILRLKELKTAYHADYDEVKNLKSQVQFCQKLVDQCRQKLLNEFDKWYAESFLSQSDDEQTSLSAGHGQRLGVVPPPNPEDLLEDDGEKFDRLQAEHLADQPDATPFYNAKLRTTRRQIYNKIMAQPQNQHRRKPGTPTRHIRNKPPTKMKFQL